LDDVIVHGQDRQIPLKGKLSLNLNNPHVPCKYGDRVEIQGHISKPGNRRNPGGVDWNSVYYRKGIIARVVPFSDDDIKVIGENQKSWLMSKVAYPLRYAILAQIERWFPSQSQPLISALLVGERDALDPAFVEATQRSGAAHLMVISGFHVGVVALILLRIISLARLPFWLQILLVLIGLKLFAMIAECRPPVVRAVIMATILGGSYLFRRLWDPWNTLAAAAFLILLIRPGDLTNPSFQLSFAAVASILCFYHPFNRFLMQFNWVHRLRRIPIIGLGFYEILLVSICAQIGVLPLLAGHFSRIPTLGIAATVLSAPLIILIVPFSLITVIIGALGIPQAAWLALTVDRLCALFQYLTHSIAGISFASLPVKTIDYALIISMFAFIILLWNYRKRWARWGVVTAIVLFGTAVVWSGDDTRLPTGMELSFLDVGTGSAAVVRFTDGRSILIDAGPCREDWDYGEKVVLPCLKSYNIDTLDAVIITHDDNDHLGGVVAVIDSIPVCAIYGNGRKGNSDTYIRYNRTLQAHGIIPQRLHAGQPVPNFEDIPIWILHPDTSFLNDHINDNDASVVLQIRVGQVAFLLPGDIESPAEDYILRYRETLGSDVLLVPHHGSASSSGMPFLEAVMPKIAVISTGKNNPHGHPSPQVLHRLEAIHCQVERTDLNGAVVLRTDGHHVWKYEGWR
jgi:competence protein ComEC